MLACISSMVCLFFLQQASTASCALCIQTSYFGVMHLHT